MNPSKTVTNSIKNTLLFLILINTFSILGQENQEVNFPKYTQKGNIKMDFLSVEMVDNEDNLGLAGIHYNFLFNEWAYGGVGIYGAVTGIRGGFFTLGVTAGIRKNIFSNVFIDGGLHFGGGGGSGAPDGGGAYILPHVNLGYQFSKFSIEAGYSYIDFFDNGNIESQQVNVAIQIPVNYDYSLFKYSEENISIENINENSNWYQKSKQFALLAHFNNLDLTGDTMDDDGYPISDKTIRTVGFEFNTFFKEHTFFFLRADGAYEGIDAGFMDLLLGIGHQLSFNKNRTRLQGKFGIGAAGGGGVDIQGGFIIYPDISLEQKIFTNTHLAVDAGYLLTPNAHFSAFTYGIGLKYYVNQSGLLDHNENTYSTSKFKGKEIILGQELYIEAARNYENPNDNLAQIQLQLNFYLNKNIFITGQTSFANFGNAGAYAEGLVGGGVSTSTNFSNNFQLFGQFLIGAAGGGFIATGQGLIIKPGVGASYFFNDKLGVRSSVGQVMAIDGELNSTSINLGLSYRFATLKSN